MGVSSFNVVYHFKKNLNYDFGKIGHFGTLDPFAEGVLMIGVQGAQRLNEYIHELLPKTYVAEGVFGQKTDSGDHTGAVIESRDIRSEFQNLSLVELEALLKEEFLGEYWQAPHSVSAVKFEGKRLYEHALSGRIITKEKVKREILDFKILKYSYPKLEFQVTVSSGTYVRSMFEEMAILFGGHGHLVRLLRSAIGENTSLNAMEKFHWPVKDQVFDLEKWGTPLDHALNLNKIILSHDQTTKYLQGRRIDFEQVLKNDISKSPAFSSERLFWVYHQSGILLGLAKVEQNEVCAVFNLRLAIDHFLTKES